MLLGGGGGGGFFPPGVILALPLKFLHHNIRFSHLNDSGYCGITLSESKKKIPSIVMYITLNYY